MSNDERDEKERFKRVYRNKSYFTRGHTQWTSYPLSIINFITIIYVLLGSQVPMLYDIFPNFLDFAVIFGIGYFLVANAMGRFDIKHGPLAVENILSFENNPPLQKIAETVGRMEGDVERLEGKVDNLINLIKGVVEE